jgi:hypothetical protein
MVHAVSIYQKEKKKKFLNPFSFHVDPMERLLLVNFESNPDVIYKGFEPQYFDDTIHGKGLLVIGWRNDLKVDVYHQKELKLKAETYDIAGKGLSHIIETDFENAVFEILDHGVHADIVFDDFLGRKVEIRIVEKHPKKREPFGLLAPMGDAAESPSAMPLVYVHDFYFVRRRYTDFQLKISGKQLKPDRFPIPLDGTWMYFARYSADPFIVTFNPAMDGELGTLEFVDSKLFVNDDTTLELMENGPAIEIKKITKKTSKHEVNLVFDPAFPQLNMLQDTLELSGKFSVNGHGSTGRIDGSYKVQKQNSKTRIILEPSRGWIPNEKKLTIKFLYAIVKTFKKWPKTYRWTAELEGLEGNYKMKSRWDRLK